MPLPPPGRERSADGDDAAVLDQDVAGDELTVAERGADAERDGAGGGVRGAGHVV